MKDLAGEDAQVIFLQMCWDGADMHNKTYNNKSIWPIFYCIMNLPPSVRGIVNVGMHMAGLDLGAMCSLDIFADELVQLWTEGFTVDGQLYKVFLIEILTDSRGREKLMRVQGAGSYAGCSKCDFEGRTLGGTRVYDRWRRYCALDDPRRAKCTSRTTLHQVMCCCNCVVVIVWNYPELSGNVRSYLFWNYPEISGNVRSNLFCHA